MRLCVITRLLAAAATVLLAAPALAQNTADVEVTAFVLNGESAIPPGGTVEEATPKTAGLTYGGSESYKVTVTNNGPSHVTSFVLDGTFTPPAAPSPYSLAIKVTAPSGCVAETEGIPLPCKMTFDPPLVAGASVNLTVGIKVPLAATLPTAPANCPTAGTTVAGSVTVPVATVLQGTTAVDTNNGNNASAVITTPIRKWADLSVTGLAGPADASEGQTITYDVTLHNSGPCDATNVFSDFTPPATLTFVSTTGCDNNASFIDDAGCDLSSADIVAGTDRSYSATFTVNTFPDDLIRAGIPIDVAVASTALNGPDDVATADDTSRVDDPVGDNDADSTLAKVDLSSNEGCSTGGAGTLFGLLSLVALRFGRRRSS